MMSARKFVGDRESAAVKKGRLQLGVGTSYICGVNFDGSLWFPHFSEGVAGKEEETKGERF
jgi:hypothetical protein